MRKDWYAEHKFSEQSEWNRRARALAWFFPCDFQTIIFSLCRGAASTWFLISFIILFSGWVMENWVWIMRGNAKHLQQPNDLEPQNSLSILFKQWISLGNPMSSARVLLLSWSLHYFQICSAANKVSSRVASDFWGCLFCRLCQILCLWHISSQSAKMVKFQDP